MRHVGRKYCFHYFYFFLHSSSFLFAISDFSAAMTKKQSFALFFFYVVPSGVIVCDHVISMQPTESRNVVMKTQIASHAKLSGIMDDEAESRLSMLTTAAYQSFSFAISQQVPFTASQGR